MIKEWYQRRKTRGHARLIFQNSAASTMASKFEGVGQGRLADALMQIEEAAKTFSMLPKPLSDEVVKALVSGNRQMRKCFCSFSVPSQFDKKFRPPEGWRAFYKTINL